MAFGWMGATIAFDAVVRKPQQMRARDRLRFGVAIALELGPDADEGEQWPILIQREPDHVLLFVSGVGSGAHSAKLLAGISSRSSREEGGLIVGGFARGCAAAHSFSASRHLPQPR